MCEERIKAELRRLAVAWMDRAKGFADTEAEHKAAMSTATDATSVGFILQSAKAAGASHAKQYCDGVVEGLRMAMGELGDYDGLRVIQAERVAA